MFKYNFDFSFIILTYNEEKNINFLLNNIYKACKTFHNEIIIIDSGSKDNTLSLINYHKKKSSNLRLIKINHKFFNYGLTRNLGIRLSVGKYIIFVSADARPVGTEWLNLFYQDITLNSKVVAVYAKQLPYKNHRFFYRLENLIRFRALEKYLVNKKVLLQSRESWGKYFSNNDEGLLYFCSNVFCCYKREYLIKNPFKKISGSEDVLIGKKIIDDGYCKVYDPRIKIYHSHNFSLNEYFYKQRDVFKVLYKNVGITKKNRFNEKLKFIIFMNDSWFKKLIYLTELFLFYLIKVSAYFFSKI